MNLAGRGNKKMDRKCPSEKEPIITPYFNKWNTLLTENKLYRVPPTPTPRKLGKFERGFILDCIAVGNIADDNFHVKPKVGKATPTYNSQTDPLLKDYFESPHIQRTLQLTGEVPPGTCIEGEAEARFQHNGPTREYLRRRNVHGCGRSMYEMAGHNSYSEYSRFRGE